MWFNILRQELVRGQEYNKYTNTYREYYSYSYSINTKIFFLIN